MEIKKYKAIFFDVDGTLVNSAPGIINGVIYTLKKYGIEPPDDPQSLTCFIGPPLRESFSKYYNIDESRFLEVEGVFREYYDVKGIFECSMYTGTKRMLRHLKESGKTLAIASSKPMRHVSRILERFGIDKCFDYVGAAYIEKGIYEKDDIIRRAVTSLGLSPQECLMVGDRLYDIEGAHKSGMDCACVLYGFGSEREFEEYGADYIFGKVSELENFLLEH
ncbi:MAG: HAD hydrolase-like protein [Eubacteriales bacterium]|nr:HAD hydrolase-like protein [Eubacteriales bacterium]